MFCDRCSYQLNFVFENVSSQKDETLHIQEYYCPGCKSCIILTYGQDGLRKSEWIDFNGK